ncbi:hypothetical protein E6P09_02560 [Haloferax mediterranei ATCC 33500]|nr:hypothetical protein [Haloferax mediterranei]AHZ22920.1 hypothetical protein BM92_09855 [Haloferax mediterranei ATCC 33500]MDX5987734.1 hypothetical protein [Haloferax mediterranei ATCC 33500]QCQ74213.1 hypothetical protein E6P09_02560 [Haloferax mediterranei ATCC 33500]
MSSRIATRWSAWLVIAVGVFVVLVGVGTLVGAPWRYASGGVAIAALQIFGAVSSVAVGVGIAWLGVGNTREKR